MEAIESEFQKNGASRGSMIHFMYQHQQRRLAAMFAPCDARLFDTSTSDDSSVRYLGLGCPFS